MAGSLLALFWGIIFIVGALGGLVFVIGMSHKF